jgi:hypothetical protein
LKFQPLDFARERNAFVILDRDERTQKPDDAFHSRSDRSHFSFSRPMRYGSAAATAAAHPTANAAFH